MSHEHAPRHESHGEIKVSSAERRELEKQSHEALKNTAEKGEHNKHEKLEKSRHETMEHALNAENLRSSQEKNSHSSAHKEYRDPRQTKLSFNTTMSHVRRHMKPAERSFSKVIHQPTVEKVSEVAGKTIARPSGVAGATIGAFIGLTLVYVVARRIGFELSGSEMPLLLVGGFVAGLFFEWVFKALRSVFTPKSI